ncbi:MAG: integrin alpha [Acidobacteriota bacterium]
MKMLSRSSRLVLAGAICSLAIASRAQVLQLDSPNPITAGRFGECVEGINDVNGNGSPDVIVGATGETAQTIPNAGRAYVFDGGTGALLHSLVSPAPSQGGHFGFAVCGVPDTNGDGIDDVAVGAYGEDEAGFGGAGHAYIFSGATGTLLVAFASPNPQSPGGFGHAMFGMKDANGDGRGDLVVGAVLESDGSGFTSTGRAYIIDGTNGQPIATLTTDTPTQTGLFSRSVGVVPDVNGDGREEVIVGGLQESCCGSPAMAGRAHIYDGVTGTLLRTIKSPNEENNGIFGEGVAGIPDVNGDCLGDVIVAAEYETVSGVFHGGRCYIMDGATGAPLQTITSPNNQDSGQFGYYVAGTTDLDGDGFGDTIIGAKWEDAGGLMDGGYSYVYSGATGALVTTLISPNNQVNGTFGNSEAALPDKNGNGGDDVIVAASREGPITSGRVYVFTSGAGVPPACGSGPPAANYFTGMGRWQANTNEVRIHTLGGALQRAWSAYASGQWGTLVASADIDGGGKARALTGPGPGAVYGPQVRAFREDGTAIAKVNFYAYGTLRYGVNVAGGSLDGDAPAEIGTGAGPGGVFGPHVRGFNYDGVSVSAIAKVSFFAYATLQYGVNVSTGDVDGDGFAELLTGPGPSPAFGAQVRGFNVDGGSATAIGKINFAAFASGTHGVNPSSGNVDADPFAEILAGRGPGVAQASQVVGFDYDAANIAALPGFDVTPFTGGYGARAAAGDLDGDGVMELVAGQGESAAAAGNLASYRYAGGALSAVAGGGFAPFPAARGIIPSLGIYGY